jgi:ABC-2 type transport system ATP-binding protein
MQDIEKTCKRIIIIDKGNKVYDDELVGIRDKYVTTRQLDVEFADNIEVSAIPNVKIESLDTLDGRKKRFSFETKEVVINQLMSEILGKYHVKDLQISEPEIESIIRRIYNGERLKEGEFV